MTAPHVEGWTGRLSDLLAHLTKELETAPAGHKVSRLLRGQALITVWRDKTTGRRVIRIAREDRPTTQSGLNRWVTELGTFEVHLGITKWNQQPDANAKGLAQLYSEPAPRE